MRKILCVFRETHRAARRVIGEANVQNRPTLTLPKGKYVPKKSKLGEVHQKMVTHGTKPTLWMLSAGKGVGAEYLEDLHFLMMQTVTISQRVQRMWAHLVNRSSPAARMTSPSRG